MNIHQKHRLAHFVAGTALLASCLSVIARENPVDPVSNPNKLEYRDVEARRPDFKEPFLRDGVVSQPGRFKQVSAGSAAMQVRDMLGQPQREASGPRGREWDYNFKFRLPRSENYLVCQYKVVLNDGGQTVRETSWRRKQCSDLVAKAGGAAS
ncbi:MAG: hypothetical protein EOO28_09660 [Comamonadaceae bacterium]|nr:MAG: hypothetical protein EOO28_09660 [Comamonadaceae bacterium]